MEIWRVESLERLDADTLSQLNRLLRDGKASLDWSAVEMMPPRKLLDVLLTGLDLSQDSDSLGIETIPTTFYKPLQAILSGRQGSRPPYGGNPSEPRSKYQQPGIYPNFDPDATTQKPLSALPDIASLVSQGDGLSGSHLGGRRRNVNEGESHSGYDGKASYGQRLRAARSRIVLDMKELNTSNATKLHDRLQPLITAYKIWVEEQEERNRSVYALSEHQEVQERLQSCKMTLARLEEGVNILKRRPDAAQAFAFMNRVMWLQHIHSLYAREKQYNRQADSMSFDRPEHYRWEPFQLAFFLLNIPALTNPHHVDRSEDRNAIADLFWSLSEVDRTDIYLGLIAYSLAIRRLQGYVGGRASENGITVLLRYLQLSNEQLQQIYSLLCACETVRRGESVRWGETPFRLGVWIGVHSSGRVPGDGLSETWKKQDVKRLAEKKLSMSYCPWCGEKIVGKSGIDKGEVGYCGDAMEHCQFSKKKAQGGGLPALLFDEEIYQVTPSVLIATVDTFMNAPWKEETRALFGYTEKKLVQQALSRHSVQVTKGLFLRPPDLVLQDDLAQISGNEGSQAGQAMIDHLSTWKIDDRKVRPKVVAALPAYLQADLQTRAMLGMREVSVFPTPGRTSEECFFFS